MTYNVEFKEQAVLDLVALAKHEPTAYVKAQTLIEELREHPRTGTGKPEQLSGDGQVNGVAELQKNIAWCTKSMTVKSSWLL